MKQVWPISFRSRQLTSMKLDQHPADGTVWGAGERRQILLAAAIPLVALAVQWAFWSTLQPFVWFLFYPAVFFSSWVGGLRGGGLATVLSAGLVWYFFMPPRLSFKLGSPHALLSIMVFVGMGALFSYFHERLRLANRQAAEAVARLQEIRDGLARTVEERTGELQQANATLRESEREFRTLAEAMPQIVWICLPDGRNVYFNQRWMEYTGLTLEESLGAGWNKPFHPEDQCRAWEAWQQATSTGWTYDLECRLRRANGDYRWFLVRGVPLREGDGRIVKWFGTCTDIHDRKRAEEALRASERRLNFALEMSQTGGGEFDLVDHTAYRTLQQARIFGYASEALPWTFERFLEHVVPEDRPEVARRVQEAMARQGSWDLECRIRRTDGVVRWIHAAGTHQPDATGQIRRAAGIVQDITDRKQLEEQLRESERRHTLLFEKSTTPTVLIKLPEVVIVDANEACAQLTGFTRQEMRGKTAAELGLTSGEARQEAISRFDHEGALDGLETRLRTKSGAERIVVSGTSPLQLGERAYAVTTLQDITERKQAMEEVLATRATLEAALASMTDAVFISDTEGRFLYFNEAFATFHRFKNKDECAKTLAEYPVFLDVFFPNGELAPLEQWAVPRALRGETVANAEYTLRRKDTGETWVGSYHFAPIRNAEGRIVGSVVVGRDVTERKRLERERETALLKYRTLFENFPMGITVADREGRIIEINRLAEQILALPSEAMRARKLGGAEWTILRADGTPMPPEEYASVRALREQVLVANQEMQVLTPGSGTKWLSVTAAPLPLADLGVVVAYADITANKRDQQALRASEERRALALEAARAGTWEWELGTGRNIWSDELWGLYGLVPHSCEPSYEAWRRTVHPKDVEALERTLQASVSAGSELALEWRVPQPNGETRWLMSRGRPSRDAAGQTVRYLGVVIDISDRKQSEANLRESELRLRLSVQAANIGLWDWDLERNTIYYSPEWKRQLGYGEAEIQHTFQEWQNRVHPQDLEAALQRVRAFIAKPEGRHEVEMRMRHRDGSYRWIYAAADVLRDPTGRPVRMLGCHLDITERKEAERALERMRSALLEAQRIAHLGSFEYIAADRTIEWSEEEYRIYGLDPTRPAPTYEAMLAKSIHPDDAAVLHETFAKAMQNCSIYELEHRIVRPDGSMRWVYDRAHPQVDERGNLLRYYGATLDITERKRAMEVLSRQTERLQWLYGLSRAMVQAGGTVEGTVMVALRHLIALLKCQPAIVGLFDRERGQTELYVANGEGETIVCNVPLPPEEALEEWAGLRQANVEIVEDTDSPVGPQLLARVLRAQGVRSYVGAPLATHQRVAGALLVAWSEPRRIPAEEAETAREVAGQVMVALEQIRLLQEATLHAQTLERRVAERTAQLEAVNHELEAFSYSVSHDLRAPLRHVHGYVDMLVREAGGQLSEKGRRYLGTIREASREMATLIDDLLAFSRLGKTEFHEVLIDLNPLVAELCRASEQANPGRRLSWRVANLPMVRGDTALLRQVLINLLGNAVKYTGPRDPAEIEIGCAGREAERAVIFVRDNGVGFDPAYAHKLFRVFQRLHRADEFEGTGIGLALVHRIIARHGGRTWAEGAVGQGATFYFTLSTEPLPPVPSGPTVGKDI